MALDLSALRRIIADENRLLTGADIPAEYQSDVLGRVHGSAEALAFPLSTEEVSALLRYAHEHRVPVTPRGAGTNLVGSTVPLEGGIILDLSRMDRVLELDEDTMTVTVEPGMLLQDLQAYVEARGLFYPPDPGEKASSIGGNISTNAGGMRTVKYGVTRDYVRGLEVVLADGTVMQVGGKQVKDASGISLKHLLIGSEGTLAVITKCLLRLVPKPEASLSVLVPYADLKTGIQSVLTILRANANPTAVEFMERKVVALGERFCGVSYPRPDAGSYILLTFDGRSEEVTANAARVCSLALQNGALDFIELSDARQCADIWRVRGERDEETWQRELHENMDRAYAEAYRLGGVASGEHGIGLSKRPYFLRQTAKENLQAMNAIKTALDPQHILNNGKSYLTGGNNNAGTF